MELSVDHAILTDSITGDPAMQVYLNTKSAREFAMFTAKHLSRSLEVKFHDVVIGKAVLRTPVFGVFEVSVLADHVEGTLNESNATEVTQKLSTGDAKLDARVVD